MNYFKNIFKSIHQLFWLRYTKVWERVLSKNTNKNESMNSLNQLKKGVTPNEDKSIRPHRICGISR